MRQLLNTLFVQTEDSYLAVDGENIIVLREEETLARLPLHNLEAILYFGYKGASPALLGACTQRNIGFSFFTPRGRLLAHAVGAQRGNVLLRRQQYRLADDQTASCLIARSFLLGKIFNSRQVIARALRDYALRLDAGILGLVEQTLQGGLKETASCKNLASLRGIEGHMAEKYFSAFDHLILRQKESFYFNGRTRRPPQDRVNALLSFTYSLLSRDCAAASEAAGLDPYVGFLHRDRPGRSSLALDLMEELRPAFADRLVLTCINERMIRPEHFQEQATGGIYLNTEGRKVLFTAWQNKKQEQILHPFLQEKIPWGLLPYVQALLLARYVRGDIDAYPPFFWR